MNTTAEHFENPADIVVIGLATATSPQTAATDIPALWGTFMQQDVAASLPRRSDDPSVYAVYCDYTSDFRGPYTLVLGVAVDPAAEVPPTMRRVRIPRGPCARFTAMGDPSQVIWQTWMFINQDWEARHQRRYIADFERYNDPQVMGTDAVQADVIVGLA